MSGHHTGLGGNTDRDGHHAIKRHCSSTRGRYARARRCSPARILIWGALPALVLFLALLLPLDGECAHRAFLKGADVSFLEQIEDSGGIYTEDGHVRDVLEILSDHGFNCIRLRIWHGPADGYCGLESTLGMAARVKQNDLGLLIDFHYSDTWAEPGSQSKPSAWSGISGQALRDSVRVYTGSVITALRDQGTAPDIVQIGNEVTCGMLWDDGRVCGAHDTPEQWDAFAALVDAAILGVRDAEGPGDSIRVMVHIDRGGDNAGSRWFFDNLMARNVDFDLIGLSFYPWWHGVMGELEANLADLARRYEKGIVVAETAYPWTLGWYDDTHNIVGLREHLHPGYAATVEGQRAFLEDLMTVVGRVPESRGAGVFYWAPEWISTPSLSSAWENVTLFDFSGEALTSIEAFDSTYAGTEVRPEPGPPLELN